MGDAYLVISSADALADDLVSEVVTAAGADTSRLRRLGQGAVDASLDPGQLPDLSDLRARFGVDVNVVAASDRAKRILIADMDSTMIGVECIDELADFAGVKAHVAEITERAMQGELDFEQAIHARVALLQGLPVSVLQTCYDQRVALNPGAVELVGGMNATGAETALVSGGFTFFTERVAAAAGFAINQANRLEEADGHLTGRVILPVLGQQAKADALDGICARLGVGVDQAVAIGDGANDLAMIRKAGLGVAYKAKPALRAEADAILDRSDLSAVLALQGVPTGT